MNLRITVEAISNGFIVEAKGADESGRELTAARNAVEVSEIITRQCDKFCARDDVKNHNVDDAR